MLMSMIYYIFEKITIKIIYIKKKVQLLVITNQRHPVCLQNNPERTLH